MEAGSSAPKVLRSVAALCARQPDHALAEVGSPGLGEYPPGQHRLVVLNRSADLKGACKCAVKNRDDRRDGDNHRG